MYVCVQLFNGFEMPLWYSVPTDIQQQIFCGSVVLVPLQRRKEVGLVVHTTSEKPLNIACAIKSLYGLGPFPADAHYYNFVQAVSDFYFLRPLHFYQCVRHFVSQDQEEEVVLGSPFVAPESGVVLTPEQQTIVDYVSPFIQEPAYTPVLVHGLTGSGKTEVYRSLIQKCLGSGKAAILLLPEVALAIQFQHLFTQYFSATSVFGFHSASTVAEKQSVWNAVCSSKPVLIIGVHLPVMLPMAHLGLIVVDEEHEHGFVEKRSPRINSKDIAVWRAHRYNIPIVLGSATPSISSLHNVSTKGWKLFQITKRFGGTLPTIQKVILTQPTARRRPFFWVSQELEHAIKNRLSKREQIIIFINRRGFSFFVQCKECGFIIRCQNCSVSLTLHVDQKRQERLRCHYCDYAQSMPTACSQCKAPEKMLIKKGVGTQQVVQIFQQLFPSAVIERADLDSTKKKKQWKETVQRFNAGQIDILIGTQTITKGYHFPNVTLVGILWADLNLHFPVYNASETTLQQLIQVAGRSGRSTKQGHVIVQVLQDHALFDYLDEMSYMSFCKFEAATRAEIGYPPYVRLACVEIRHKLEKQVDVDAAIVADVMHQTNESLGCNVSILGPAFPVVSRMNKYEIRHIMLKAQSFNSIKNLFSAVRDNVECESELLISMSV